MVREGEERYLRITRRKGGPLLERGVRLTRVHPDSGKVVQVELPYERKQIVAGSSTKKLNKTKK